jgi:hypothetical protein
MPLGISPENTTSHELYLLALLANYYRHRSFRWLVTVELIARHTPNDTAAALSPRNVISSFF